MDRNEVFEKVAEAVADTMDVEADELTEATTFESLSADSLDRIELVTALEDAFDTTIDDDDLANIQTLGDAVEAILAAE